MSARDAALLNLLLEVTDALANNVSHTSEEAEIVDRAREVLAQHGVRYRCAGKRGNCDALAAAKGELCGHCEGVLDAQIEDYEERPGYRP